jgi:hypothetical protein
MSRQTWYEIIVPDFIASGSMFSAYSATQSIIPAAYKIDFPKNHFTLGKKLKIEASVDLSNIITTPGTWSPSVNFSSSSVAAPGAIQLTTTANALAQVLLTCWLDVQVAGTAAQFMHGWRIDGINICAVGASGANNAAGTGTLSGPNPAALGTAFDATSALTLDFYAGFSIAASGNQVRVRQYRVISEN